MCFHQAADCAQSPVQGLQRAEWEAMGGHALMATLPMLHNLLMCEKIKLTVYECIKSLSVISAIFIAAEMF